MKLLSASILLSISLYSTTQANTLGERSELINKADKSAQISAKIICPQFIYRDLFLKNPASPITVYKRVRRFHKLNKTYFNPTKYFWNKKNKKKILEGTRFDTHLLSTGNTYESVFNSSLMRAVNLIAFDPIEMMDMKSFYISSIFDSNIFADEIQKCEKHFGLKDANLIERIQKHMDIMNHAGYITGQATSFMLGSGLLKSISKLPKIIKYTLYGSGLSYIAYSSYKMINPSLKALKEIKEDPEKYIENTLDDPIFRFSWGNLFNQCVQLKDAHTLAFEAKEQKLDDADQRLKEFQGKIKALKQHSPKLKYHMKKYLEISGDEISPEQVQDLELLTYVFSTFEQ